LDLTYNIYRFLSSEIVALVLMLVFVFSKIASVFLISKKIILKRFFAALDKIFKNKH